MTKAFVFGKFSPFHKGHEAMIKFALSKCDFLTVLVCCSDKEIIPDYLRKIWIEKAFENIKNFEVRTFNYKEDLLPNTSKSSRGVSEIWAEIFKKQFPDYSLLITSEDYGNFVAEIMGIQHITFDKSRKLYPISATAVRNDIFSNWDFLPESVKPYFAIKMVILGTESTGKTTLTKKLARHFNCSCVVETARDIIPNSKLFTFEDLYLVATEHAAKINQAIFGDSPLIIIDTDIFITMSYAQFVFKKEFEVSSEVANANCASLYLYLNNDVDFIQDGTRFSEVERNLLDISHKQVLKDHEIEFVEIGGDWDERFKKAVEQIKKLLAAKGNIH